MSADTPLRRLELLAPARSVDIGREAVLHGADAVYIGGPAFGARHNAGNDMAGIARLADFAHRFRVRIYVTLNTILHDDELEAARRLAWQCFDAGVDALIVQDMGLLELDLPPLALHASTQCDIRSPQKARFLAEAGFSQIVLARELTLAEIAAVRAAVPQDTVIEHFVHGALCVAYSGQCYISHAHTGRSANRGDCSQACRLPYTLSDAQGRVVAFDQHLLSLKDNDQSANLGALVEAGVASFKIEGRYKDAAYVKNVTGHYRRLLDALMERRGDLAPAASGRVALGFTPDPARSFHRGRTDYFSHGRRDDIGAFAAPGFLGVAVGAVTRLTADGFEMAATAALANGDGLAYLHQRGVVGLQADRVVRLGETADGTLWRVWPNESIAALPGLAAGVAVHRNRDHAWDQMLAKPSARRRIAIIGRFAETAVGFELTFGDDEGNEARASLTLDKEPARDPADAVATLCNQLGRLGETDFTLQDLHVEARQAWFVPASLANRLRREAVAALVALRAATYVRPPRKPAGDPPPRYPDSALSYLGNVYNRAARAFYERHGVRAIEAAYEAHEEAGEVSLMITRHCLRYAFSLCPKQAKGVAGVQGQVRAEPMLLANGDERLRLVFDCRACEMHVMGRMRRPILAGPPPGAAVAPVTVHRGGRRAPPG